MSKFDLELLRYQRLASLGRDLGGFVHNIAGPLNVMLGYVQIIKAKFPEDKAISNIWNAGLELDTLLKELRGHIEESENNFYQQIKVNEVIQRSLELLRANSFFKHNIETSEELCSSNPEIFGIYGDFAIIIDVLLNNAIEAVHGNDLRKICVATKLGEDGKTVQIIIRDTGNGINEALMADYFREGFSNWSNSLKICQGMGLPLAHYLCQKLGGSLSLRNSAGIGAEAVLELPTGESGEV